MNKEETRLLLNQFYLGDITIDEERRLVNLLLSDDCPEDLRAERHAIISLARKEAIDMPEDLKQNIISTIRTTNTGRSHRWVMGIAAGLLLVLGFFLWSLLPKDRKPEHNPQETLAETVKSVQPIQPIRQPILPPAVTNTPLSRLLNILQSLNPTRRSGKDHKPPMQGHPQHRLPTFRLLTLQLKWQASLQTLTR